MISLARDRLETPPAPARVRTREGAQHGASSRIGADNSHDRPRPSRHADGIVLAVIAVVLASLRVWRARRRTRRQLGAMSARELQDIGLCRSEIVHEIGRPFWRALAVANAFR